MAGLYSVDKSTEQSVMNGIPVPVESPTDMVADVACLGAVCLAVWGWALGRLLNIVGPRETESTPRWLSHVQPSLIALATSAPAAYYLFWLLTTPPAVISAVGVTRDAGPLNDTPTTIRWSEVTSIECTYPLWRRVPRRFELSVQSGTAKIWIGRMTRVQAEKVLKELQAHVPTSVIHDCPAWTEVPPLRSTERHF